MRLNNKKGFSLIEVIVVSAVFVVLALGIYQAFVGVKKSIQLSRRLAGATALASNQMEIMRNLPYADVKSQTGSAESNGFNFSIITSVQTVDDSYKLVTVQVEPVILNTYIAP